MPELVTTSLAPFMTGDSMNITRINQFHAADGKAHQLLGLLKSIVDELGDCQGLVHAELLQSAEHPRDLVITEVWDSIKSHQEAARSIAPERVKEVVSLLDQPPKGSYFTVARTAHPAPSVFETLI